ncbi:hypothetical protein [Dinoroseobacter sp. S76]|uniref:hypothetical protein n=1 Tax=Dinoroseobacter sp. S76 TaxID=3415124 RepID=UPI003C7AB78B
MVRSLALAAALVCAAPLVQAQSDILPAPGTEFTAYGMVEGWSIFVNEDRKTCMIERVDAAENVVQMGLTVDRSFGYLGVFTKQETALKDGEETVAVLIGENLYVGTGRTVTSGLPDGYEGGYIISDDPQFLADIMQQYEMIVLPTTEYAFVVDLTGTMKAIEAARACNDAQLG